jgi:uncharacterized protein
MKMLSAALICALTSITLSSSAEALVSSPSNPSFNCNRAQTDAELAICRIPSLGAKDRAIASLYQRLRAATPRAKRAALVQNQTFFNRSREFCYESDQENDACLEARMNSRITDLNRWLRNGFTTELILR